MPDNWEYPWYAAWDLAFHMIPFARLDPHFAKEQLVLMLREWYTHPNGQIPAYEFAFGDVNPPVQAWAAWRVYKITGPRRGRDRLFLERVFQKLLINFTWWVNRKDADDNNVFAGGFLGLDNIGVFDRSQPLPGGRMLEQADGTAWMAFYCTTMLAIALELARQDPAYEDVASKFFEHFVAIADAMNTRGRQRPLGRRRRLLLRPIALRWHADSAEGAVDGRADSADRGRSAGPDDAREAAGIPKAHALVSGESARSGASDLLPAAAGRSGAAGCCWPFPRASAWSACCATCSTRTEFLSPYGIRSVSRYHLRASVRAAIRRRIAQRGLRSGGIDIGLFGGNSNWRGPVWFPVNYLLIEALERYHHFYGDRLQVECPAGSGRMMNLNEVARELNRRLAAIFLPDENGRSAWQGGIRRLPTIRTGAT